MPSPFDHTRFPTLHKYFQIEDGLSCSRNVWTSLCTTTTLNPFNVPQKHWIMVASSLPSISSLSSTFLHHLIDIPRHRCLTTTYNIRHCLVLIQKCVLRLVFMDQYYSEFCISQARLPTHLHWVIMAYFWYCHALHLESLHSPKGQACWK